MVPGKLLDKMNRYTVTLYRKIDSKEDAMKIVKCVDDIEELRDYIRLVAPKGYTKYKIEKIEDLEEGANIYEQLL